MSLVPTEPKSRPFEPAGQPLQLARHRLGVVEGADLTGRAGPLDQVDLLFPAARPGDREPAGHQVVAAIAGGYVHHVAGGAEAADFLRQDQLHARHWSVPPLCLASRAGVREKSHLACVLDRGRDVTLVPGAVPGHAAGADLAPVRDVLAQQPGVLVVDVADALLAEDANLLLRLLCLGGVSA